MFQTILNSRASASHINCSCKHTGNLYYALTHSPEPMSEEYSYALTWEAATERFEKAGCIPVEEAKQYKKWVESGNAGVEASLERVSVICNI